MNTKIIPAIYLYKKMAVSSFHDTDISEGKTAAFDAAMELNDHGADTIMVFDLSYDDPSHEEALDVIKEITTEADAEVIGAGNIKRMEDVKKLLYAGCKKAALNFSKEGNVSLMKEVSEKFGKDKIAVCYSDAKQINDHLDLIQEYASQLIFVSSASEDGKSETESTLPTASTTDSHKDGDYTISPLQTDLSFDKLKKNSDGMVPVVVQDYRTNEVLMVAYMNEEAYHKTLETGRMTYYSRSRNELWLKGETSGHYQYVKSLTADCDLDTILAKVKQIGAACHTGSYSCFFNEIAKKEYKEKNPQKVLDDVYNVIADRKINPREGSYTNYLFDKGIDKILKKCGEENTEIVIAAKNPNPNEIVYEISDYLYHLMVLMVEKGVDWKDITDELARR